MFLPHAPDRVLWRPDTDCIKVARGAALGGIVLRGNPGLAGRSVAADLARYQTQCSFQLHNFGSDFHFGKTFASGSSTIEGHRRIRDVSKEIVFLISPTPRSGTNFVRNMLVGSGLCTGSTDKLLGAEDWFLPASDGLIQFRNKIADCWTMLNLVDEKQCTDLADRMLKRIGEALAGEIVSGATTGPILSKTPSSENISNLDRLFPASRLILLVRDGRDTCYSAIKSGFYSSPREIFSLWAYRVDEMIEYAGMPDFDRTDGRHLWIRYESAVEKPLLQLSRAEKYLGIQVDDSKRAVVQHLDIVGSSDFSSSDDGSFNYTVVSRSEDFNPIGRWRHWDEELRSEFKEIAGRHLISLGYEQNDDW